MTDCLRRYSEKFGASSIVVSEDAAGVWKVSSRYTALRLLSVIALLRTAVGFEGTCMRGCRRQVGELMNMWGG